MPPFNQKMGLAPWKQAPEAFQVYRNGLLLRRSLHKVVPSACFIKRSDAQELNSCLYQNRLDVVTLKVADPVDIKRRPAFHIPSANSPNRGRGRSFKCLGPYLEVLT